MPKLPFVTVVVSALLLPATVLAIDLTSMRNMPISRMNDEDRAIFKTALIDALERKRDGEGARWENSKTGAHGDLLPRASFEREGRRCRDLEVANSAGGLDNRLVVTLCRQADGAWKVESQ
ncbi:MAG: hypothetical protein H7X76_06145 [Prolixibacteraceae bacterium]|nr:hypothetical protein [Burkholderiales bacterium]